VRQRALAQRVALDDLLATLYRIDEAGRPAPALERVAALLPAHDVHRAVELAQRRRLVAQSGEVLALSPTGHAAAEEIIRRHRLWEAYLVDEAGVPVDRVHDQAERLEHAPVQMADTAATDPHGRTIPTRHPHKPG
jgi:Mn-dependent DtxR family transcriptional regulator